MPHLSLVILPGISVFAAYAVFLGSYLVFAIGKFPGMKIDRPGAAIIGAVLMVAFRVVLPQNAFHFIDFGTIVLLFSMMLIVGCLRLAGFFEWIADLVLMRLKPRHLLPAVIFTCGLLSAFFVNDIICLAMVPFVLSATKRLGAKPLPFLLAVATASNIGSVASITGNPQNMLIGSLSGIGYSSFLLYLAPVAVVGLLLDWLVLHIVFSRGGLKHPSPATSIPAFAGDRSSLIRPGIVILIVLAGFLAGVPPAIMAALGGGGDADDLYARSSTSLPAGGLGHSGVLCGTFCHCGWSRGGRAGGPASKYIENMEHSGSGNFDRGCGRHFKPSEQRSSRHATKIPCSRFYAPAHGMADSGDGQHTGGQSDHHRLGGEHHCS